MNASLTYFDDEENGILVRALPGDTYDDVALQCYYKAQMTDRKITLLFNCITTIFRPTTDADRDAFKKRGIQ